MCHFDFPCVCVCVFWLMAIFRTSLLFVNIFEDFFVSACKLNVSKEGGTQGMNGYLNRPQQTFLINSGSVRGKGRFLQQLAKKRS